MTGNDIPLVTWNRVEGGKIKTFKKPKYELRPAKEIKEIQDRLGGLLNCYYGTTCKKCCGVYPAFMTEGGLTDYGYYVCLVCGKESKHEPMSWMARKSWNNGLYEWEPTNRQLSIFDLEEVIE